MSRLFWNREMGRANVPPCDKCGSKATVEHHERSPHDPQLIDIYVKCATCGEMNGVGRYRSMGHDQFRAEGALGSRWPEADEMSQPNPYAAAHSLPPPRASAVGGGTLLGMVAVGLFVGVLLAWWWLDRAGG